MQTAGLFLNAEAAYRREQLQKTYRPIPHRARDGWIRRAARRLHRTRRPALPATRAVAAPHH